MSRDLNKCMFIGRLGNDPSIRYTPSGSAVANLSIACSDSYTEKNTRNKVDKTEWVRVVAFNRLAEIMGEYLKKGSQVYIEGKLQTRKWQDKDNQDRYTTEIVASEMQMLGSSSGDRAASNRNDQKPQSSPPTAGGGQSHQPTIDDYDDDIPF